MPSNITLSQEMQEACLLAYAGGFGALDIYTGERPTADPALTDQTLLARFIFGSVSEPITLEGTSIVYITWGSATGLAEGIGTWFRAHIGDPNSAFDITLDGSVGTTIADDLSFSTNEFAIGSLYIISSFPLTMANNTFNTSSTIEYGGSKYFDMLQPIIDGAVALKLYDGNQPQFTENPPTTQNLLISFPVVSSSSLSQLFFGTATAGFTGDATWFRLVDSSGTGLMDGTVGINDPFSTTDTEDIRMPSVSFVATELYDGSNIIAQLFVPDAHFVP